MKQSQEERFLMMLYSPGDRPGLIQALEEMSVQLTPEEVFLAELTNKVLKKLTAMSNQEFAQIDLYAEMEGFNVG